MISVWFYKWVCQLHTPLSHLVTSCCTFEGSHICVKTIFMQLKKRYMQHMIATYIIIQVHTLMVWSCVVRSYFQCVKPWETVLRIHLYFYKYDYNTLTFCSLLHFDMTALVSIISRHGPIIIEPCSRNQPSKTKIAQYKPLLSLQSQLYTRTRQVASLIKVGVMYVCIVGNFRGRKFSRLTSIKTFHELNFEDCL